MTQSISMAIGFHTGVITSTAGYSESEVDLLRIFCMKNHQPIANNYSTLLLDSDKCFSAIDSPDQVITKWLLMSTATTQTSFTATKCLL